MISQPKSRIDQTKRGMRVQDIPRVRMFVMVTMKFTAPATVDTVSRWSERIQRSCRSRRLDRERRIGRPARVGRAAVGEEAQHEHDPADRKNQYDSAFSRGNATSRAPIMSGTRKFAKPARIGTPTRKPSTCRGS